MRIPLSAVLAAPSSIDRLYPLPLLGNGHSQPGEGDSPIREWSSFIGISTAIVGNLLISFALNTQRYAHIRIEREHKAARQAARTNGPTTGNSSGYGTLPQGETAEARVRARLGSRPIRDGNDESSLRPSLQSANSRHHQEKEDDEDGGRESYLKSPYWWLGLVLMIIGEAGNFLAYGFAPASIVSPLGVVALISNCMIAPLMLKERFRKRDLGGVLVAITGAVVVVLSANTSEEKFGPGELWRTIKRWEFLLYVILTFIAIVALMWASPKYGRRTILVDLGLVGLFGGYTALSTKGVASLLSASLYKAFAFPITYFLIAVLVVSALMQIRYLNRALQIYDSTQVIPTQFVLFTLSVILGSAVLYRDFEHTTGDQATKFIIGCLFTFFGVYLITSQRDEDNDEDAGDDDDEDEAIHLIDEHGEAVDERTPLKHESRPSTSQLTISQHDGGVSDGLQTPRRNSNASSLIPSIAVTPAESFDHPLEHMFQPPIDETESQLPPRTPQISRIQAESGTTPFFTPSTSSQGLQRSMSTPAESETPSKPPPPQRLTTSPGHATPDVLVETSDFSPEPSFLTRSARGSISRLLPGPLLPPLSSSLSALVADSLLRGEGSPRSVRVALRRGRSARQQSWQEDHRRRMTTVGDDENPLLPRSSEDLSRSQTRDTMPLPAVRDIIEGQPDQETRQTRLRALSETLSGMIGRGKGKRRDVDADEESSGTPSRNQSTS
ncbi:hypothetical protein PV10_06095 [Exophiala mesophila]|uniref:Uncharacterized protein n=1 Tax=Exophiala mesophila TaxID=212818 RepID=A0A0D1ZA81_EXOME|nr:uncharacterized protein PV10_06095 [Exophiala mesophila]KIV91572.1 hypothetical protein PV10_06095 [Exophiala mesophila]